MSNKREVVQSEIKPGQLIYECGYGHNLEALVVTQPEITGDVDGRSRWSWQARNTQTGELINYVSTEGLEIYGPRIYAGPQYISIHDGSFLFPLHAGDPFDPQDPEEIELRKPENLTEWSKAMAEAYEPVSLKAWVGEQDKDNRPVLM